MITFYQVRQGKPNHRTILEIIFKLIFRQILAQTLQVGAIIGYTERIRLQFFLDKHV